jgi:hypothetical protein
VELEQETNVDCTCPADEKVWPHTIDHNQPHGRKKSHSHRHLPWSPRHGRRPYRPSPSVESLESHNGRRHLGTIERVRTALPQRTGGGWQERHFGCYRKGNLSEPNEESGGPLLHFFREVVSVATALHSALHSAHKHTISQSHTRFNRGIEYPWRKYWQSKGLCD